MCSKTRKTKKRPGNAPTATPELGNENAILAVPRKPPKKNDYSRTYNCSVWRFSCFNIFIKCSGHSVLDHFFWIACFGRGSCQVVLYFVSVFEVTLWAWVVYRCVYALAFFSSRSVFIFLEGIAGASRQLVATTRMVSAAGSRGRASLQKGVCSQSRGRADHCLFCLRG